MYGFDVSIESEYTQIKLPVEVYTTVPADLHDAINASGVFCSHALHVSGATWHIE